MITQDTDRPKAPDLYIPDLCRVRAVFLLLVTTELVVLLFALIRGDNRWIDWDFFGLASLFSQWAVLTCAALICSLRSWLARLSVPQVTLAVMFIIQLDVLLFSLFANGLLQWSAWHFAWNWRAIGHNLLIALIVSGIVLRYFFLQFQWRRQKQAELSARLTALQARIHPHFLFNSMNTIASLIATRPEQAEDVVLDLSELFRASLRTQERLIPLDEEIALCRRYLHIEQLRLAERLSVEWSLAPGIGHQAIPPLTLQPLLENAIYHGIQPRPDGGRIRIETQHQGNAVYILVHNPLPTAGQRSSSGNRIALDNIRARLATLFGEQAVLKTSRPNDEFTVTIRLPWRPLNKTA